MGKFRPVEAGERFGRLLVTRTRARNEIYVDCVCDCGTEKAIKFTSLGRQTNSCGCLHRESLPNRNFRHGKSRTPIHNIWWTMIQRCTNPTVRAYGYYGGRGITVCERWLRFENFYADMGDRPEGRTLDRIDNDGPYSPENCRWATLQDQRANQRKRTLKLLCIRGHEFTPENTAFTTSGQRACRACRRILNRGWYDRNGRAARSEAAA